MKIVFRFARWLVSLIGGARANIRREIAVWGTRLAETGSITDDTVPPEVKEFLATLTEEPPSDELLKTKEREVDRFSKFTHRVAFQKFLESRKRDPLPEISSALLNSADISDYVAATGMISPFNPEKLKPASYAISFLGKCVYWDENGEKQVQIIRKDDQFILRKNSIAFVTLEPVFLIPDYIALRFNLKITHIYRGVLLGTGPLIDPGYTGKMSVPLHNLTNNDYVLVGGEDLIWMEFTKVSDNKRWNENSVRDGLYHPFPHGKSLPDVESYLRKADPHRSIRSSIPEVTREATEKAKEAAKSVQWFTSISIIAVLGITIPLISYFNQTQSYLRESERTIQRMNSQLIDCTNMLQNEIDKLKRRIDESDRKKQTTPGQTPSPATEP